MGWSDDKIKSNGSTASGIVIKGNLTKNDSVGLIYYELGLS